MPVQKIAISCQMENLEKIYAEEDLEYRIKIECSKCHEKVAAWQSVGSSEQLEIPGSRGEANFIYRCKMCKAVNTLNIVKDSRKPYLSSYVPMMKPIIAFECRGMTIIDFEFGEGWKVVSSESGRVFEAALDGDFYNYDEIANCPVEVSELDFTIMG